MKWMNWFRVCVALLALCAVSATPVLATNILSVVEFNGDNTGDSIPAKWTGQTFTPTDGTHLAPGEVLNQPYTIGYFGAAPNLPPGSLGHATPNVVDRKHTYADGPTVASGGALVQNFAGGGIMPVYGPDVPSYLLGGEYIMAANSNRDNATYQLDVTIAQPSIVYLLVDNRMNSTLNADTLVPGPFDATHMEWAQAAGFTPVQTGANHWGQVSLFSLATRAAGDPNLPDEVAFDQNSDGYGGDPNNLTFFSVYSKSYWAGTFSLFQADNPGRNMYGVVIQAVPEPTTVGLILLAASVGACIRRKR